MIEIDGFVFNEDQGGEVLVAHKKLGKYLFGVWIYNKSGSGKCLAFLRVMYHSSIVYSDNHTSDSCQESIRHLMSKAKDTLYKHLGDLAETIADLERGITSGNYP